jgi:hypothetical protein
MVSRNGRLKSDTEVFSAMIKREEEIGSPSEENRALWNKDTDGRIGKLTVILIIKPGCVIVVTAIDRQVKATGREWNIHAPGFYDSCMCPEKRTHAYMSQESYTGSAKRVYNTHNM